jgi:pimeloyl-ACP methyl ester carboxylesterase
MRSLFSRFRAPMPSGALLALVLGSALALNLPARTDAGPRPGAGAPGDELPRKSGFGAVVAPVPEEIRKREKLGENEGILVQEVLPGSTAEEGGFRAGDLVLAMEGRPVQGLPAFIEQIGRTPAGQRFQVTFLREGKRETKPVTMRERPRDRGENFDVLYHHVVSNGARIRTIVSRPHAPGRHPVFMLIQGLGPQSVDQPLSGAGMYSRIVGEFARRGYVTVRVDKPGVGDSEGGPYADTDFDTELDIYRQALKAARAYDFVDPEQLFLFGHSMGGAFGPILAAEIPVRGIAVYGTVAKSWIEYFLENSRRQEALAGTDPAVIDQRLKQLDAAMHYLLTESKIPEQVRREHPELKEILDELLPDQRTMFGRIPRFWAQLASQNFPAFWARGNASVLAIWGKNEFITTEEDHPLIAAIVNRARPGKGRYVALEASDHAFKKTTSKEDSFRRWSTPGEFNPAIITTLKSWMEEVRKG